MSRETKFRNKITGVILTEETIVKKLYSEKLRTVSSIMKFMEDWEEIEESKGYYINMYGDIDSITKDIEDFLTPYLKAIGNYFETKEQAEKAVEKLKAWKRLKDKGLEIKGWKFTPDMKHIKGNFVKVEAEIPYIVDNQADLDLLFGGGE